MTQRPIGCIQQKRKAQDGLHNSICTHPAPTSAWREETPNCMITGVLTHKSTLILIESGYFYFSQKPQYFWAFHDFRPISESSGTGLFCVYGVFSCFRPDLGSLNYSLSSLSLWGSSLVLSLGSLKLWVVR